MTKSQIPSDLSKGTKLRVPSLASKIEAGKYVTDKDRQADKQALEEADARAIVNRMKDIEPFGGVQQ